MSHEETFTEETCTVLKPKVMPGKQIWITQLVGTYGPYNTKTSNYRIMEEDCYDSIDNWFVSGHEINVKKAMLNFLTFAPNVNVSIPSSSDDIVVEGSYSSRTAIVWNHIHYPWYRLIEIMR